MKQKPSIQFYQQDFLGALDVQMMNAEEVGCYCLLIFNCYNNGGELPNDAVALRTLCRGTEISKNVMKKFYVKGDVIRHKRIDSELKKKKKHSQTQAANARKRWGSGDKKPKESAMPSHPDGNAAASERECSSSSSSNSNTSNEVLEEKKPAPAQTTAVATVETFPIPRPDVNPSLWQQWLAMRKKKKKPLTDVGYNRLLKHLAKLPKLDLNDRLEQAIDNQWQGLVFNNDLNGAKPNGTSNGNYRNERSENAIARMELDRQTSEILRNAGIDL